MPKTRRSRRETHHINRRTTQHIYRAFDVAKARGDALIHYIVLHLGSAGQEDQAEAVGALIEKFRVWLAHKHTKGLDVGMPDYALTIEAPGKTVHMNWAVRVPAGFEDEFSRKLNRWAERVCGPMKPAALHIARIDPLGYKSLANYMLKGTDELYVPHFHLGNGRPRRAWSTAPGLLSADPWAQPLAIAPDMMPAAEPCYLARPSRCVRSKISEV